MKKIWLHVLLFHQICTLAVQARSKEWIFCSWFLSSPFVFCMLFKIHPSKCNRAAMKKTESLNGEISETEQQVREVEQRNHSLRLKKKAMNEELEGLRAKVEAGQREYRRLLKELEVRIEEEAQLTGNRYIS